MGVESLVRYGDMGKNGEYIHLRGYRCINNKCSFCIFPQDNSYKTKAMIEFNKKIIDKVHGRSKILEVYNFGSIFELPVPTLFYLHEKIHELGIEHLITDSHWYYRDSFEKLRNFFGIDVMIKIGLETFDNELREKSMRKNMGYVSPDEILKYTDAVNLIIGYKGQTKEQIKKDISIVEEKFRFADINILDPKFTPKGLIDYDIIDWFLETYKDSLSKKFRINYEVS